MKAYFQMFAGYNAWANTRLYVAVEQLTARQYRENRGAFFKSVQGTLNHLLSTDRIWMQRLTGEGSAPDRLDTILFDDFASLRAARRVEDRRIIDHIDSLDDAAFAGVIRYRRVSTPDVYEQALTPALAHLFNHQTHHRGQVHALLTAMTGQGPELDLLFYQRLTASDQA